MNSQGHFFDNLIYRANIFNYDNKFLIDTKQGKLHLDLQVYSKGNLKHFNIFFRKKRTNNFKN